MVKPRLYEGEDRSGVSATLLHVLEETLALMHPVMPFVTEEIYAFLPGADGHLAVRRFPQADESLIDEQAEREVETAIEATRRLRRYRDILGVPAAARIPARLVPAGRREGETLRTGAGHDPAARALRSRAGRRQPRLRPAC